MVKSGMHKPVLLFLICITGAFLNIASNVLFAYLMKLPLFMDTIFTIAVTLSFGLVWGVLCGVLTNLTSSLIWFQGWGGLLFAFCSIAAACTTWLFMKLFPYELNMTKTAPKMPYDIYKKNNINKLMDKIIVLILLSFALCLAMSVLGGLIAAIILSQPSSHSPGAVISMWFRETMFSGNFPVFLSEIFTRIPVNIIDRLISVFAGYGIAFGIRAIFRFPRKNHL